MSKRLAEQGGFILSCVIAMAVVTASLVIGLACAALSEGLVQRQRDTVKRLDVLVDEVTALRLENERLRRVHRQ